jgi:hypothetical protein
MQPGRRKQGISPREDGRRVHRSWAAIHQAGIAEIFLGNHKTNSSADTNARDIAIVASLALQYGADIETIRKALCRDSHGRASGPLGTALDLLAGIEGGS